MRVLCVSTHLAGEGAITCLCVQASGRAAALALRVCGGDDDCVRLGAAFRNKRNSVSRLTSNTCNAPS